MDREKLRKTVALSGWLGAAFWTGVWITTAIMLVSFGVWPFVAWALVFLVWTWHLGKIHGVYKAFVKGKPKWEQNVTFNVSTDLTEEQIAAAVKRATDVELRYGS